MTVLDIDTSDERLLADALSRHGPTPIIVRTAGGQWHAWYRHSNERRRIRPWGDDLPIDLLGTGGFVIAPPSATHRGHYQFIQGSLDDLASLPSMRPLGASFYDGAVTVEPDEALVAAEPVAEHEPRRAVVSEGLRNGTLFRHCMRHAHRCDDLDTLMGGARTFNDGFIPPLPDDEVIKTVKSAWSYTARGENRFGTTGSFLPTDTVRALVPEPYLLALMNFLIAENRPDARFMIADGLHKVLRWPRRKLQTARRRAIEAGFVVMVSKPHSGRAAVYRFGLALKRGRERREGRCRLRIAYQFWLV